MLCALTHSLTLTRTLTTLGLSLSPAEVFPAAEDVVVAGLIHTHSHREAAALRLKEGRFSQPQTFLSLPCARTAARASVLTEEGEPEKEGIFRHILCVLCVWVCVQLLRGKEDIVYAIGTYAKAPSTHASGGEGGREGVHPYAPWMSSILT